MRIGTEMEATAHNKQFPAQVAYGAPRPKPA